MSNEDRIPVYPELLEIAEHIEQGKWCTDLTTDFALDGMTKVAHCAGGWLLDSNLAGISVPFFMYSKLNDYVISLGYAHIPDWNDTPERTKEEVADTFRRMAYGDI